MSAPQKKAPPSEAAIKAAELEIGANHLRALRKCRAQLGSFVQQAIDKALDDQKNATASG